MTTSLLRKPGHALALGLLLVFAGCQTPPQSPKSTLEEQHGELTLREGDVIKIAFPGARNLEVPPLPIRRDGKITLPIVGEVIASGLTPTDLQNKLAGLYANQLLSHEVTVDVISSTFAVFVDGAVLRSGKIISDHPISVLEAIMEAGGFDYQKANTEKVMIIRRTPKSKEYTYYTINLKAVLKGEERDLFYLAPGDMVHVPEKFSWF